MGRPAGRSAHPMQWMVTFASECKLAGSSIPVRYACSFVPVLMLMLVLVRHYREAMQAPDGVSIRLPQP